MTLLGPGAKSKRHPPLHKRKRATATEKENRTKTLTFARVALGCFHYSKPAARCTPPCLCLYSANVSLCRPGLMFPSFPLSLLVPPLFHHASFSFLFILSPFNAPFFTSALNPALARLSFESRSPSHTHHSLSLSQARQLFVSPARFSGHSNQQSKKESKKRQESSQIEQATAISGNRNQGRFRPHSTALAKPAPTGLDPNHFPLSFSSHCSNWSQRCIASRSSPSLVHKRSKKKTRNTIHRPLPDARRTPPRSTCITRAAF